MIPRFWNIVQKGTTMAGQKLPTQPDPPLTTYIEKEKKRERDGKKERIVNAWMNLTDAFISVNQETNNVNLYTPTGTGTPTGTPSWKLSC